MESKRRIQLSVRQPLDVSHLRKYARKTNPPFVYLNRFGATFADIPSVADQQALDTNRNGQLDGGDDPYSPWYPGDDLVDWIGISLYCEFRDVRQIDARPKKF